MKRLLITGFVLAAFLLSGLPAFSAEQTDTTVKKSTVKHKKGKKLKKKKVSSMAEIDKLSKAEKTSKKTAKKQKKVKASSTEKERS